MVIQVAPPLTAAVQAHPAVAVTATLPVPPLAVKDWEVGARPKAQDPPDWLTLNVCPATVMLPLRDEPVLLATENPSPAVPVPLPPEVTLIQEALLVAVQAQEACVT